MRYGSMVAMLQSTAWKKNFANTTAPNSVSTVPPSANTGGVSPADTPGPLGNGPVRDPLTDGLAEVPELTSVGNDVAETVADLGCLPLLPPQPASSRQAIATAIGAMPRTAAPVLVI